MRARTARVLTALAVVGLGCTTTTAAASPPPRISGTPTVEAAAETAGLGWAAFVHHPNDRDDVLGTLRVRSPEGVTEVLGSLPSDARLDDITSDGRYVLTTQYSSADEEMRLTVWDVSERTSTTFEVGWDVMTTPFLAAFGADGILFWSDQGLLSLRLDGTTARVLDGLWGITHVSADGRRAYVMGGASSDKPKVTEHDLGTGRVLQTWDVPAGYYDFQCGISQEWDKRSAVLDCQDQGPGPDYLYQSRSFRLVAGGKVEALTPVASAFALPTSTRRAAWRQTPAQTDFGCVEVGQRVGATLKPVAGLPIGGCPAHYAVVGAAGRYAYFLKQPAPGAAGPWKSTLMRYDTVANGATPLLGSESPSGGVITYAVTVDGHH